ncbi:MBL fold metallo-hydrolase [bacterium]|nr:MBL fold metallo-hydrolase [bacterium]
MKKIIIFLSVVILALSFFPEVSISSENQIEMTILYDNYLYKEGLTSDWGFSCLIKGPPKTILFDTGTQGHILFQNIQKLDINPQKVQSIVISHDHGDHTGGLIPFLKKNHQVTVYFPDSFPDDFHQRIKALGAQVVPGSDPQQICKDVYLTGELGTSIKEQSLILDTDKGLVVITGCSHPGIIKILEQSKEVLQKNIYLVFGGFHLINKSEEEINEIISRFKELGVTKVGATHCTGKKAINLFKKAYKENFIQMGVGRVIQIFD